MPLLKAKKLGGPEDNIKITEIGGLAVRMINKTGGDSVKGRLVESHTDDNSVEYSGVSDSDTIGVFLDSDVPDGALAWIVFSGMAELALKDNTASTAGNWVKASDEAGYADATLADPPGGGIPEIDEHFQELGHCLQSVAAAGAGTHVLTKCLIHFN